MEFIRKHINIIVVAAVVLVAGVVALGISLSGMKNGDYDYVMIDTPGKVEMIVTKDRVIDSVYARNDEGAMLLSLREYIGSDLEEAIDLMLYDSMRLGLIDTTVDDKESNNCIKLTVVSGLTNSLEKRVFTRVYQYLSRHQVYAVILENEKDMKIIRMAREYQISSPDKMELINSIEEESGKNITLIRGETEEELIDMIRDIHLGRTSYTQYLSMADERLSMYESKFFDHEESVSDKTAREFATKYEKYLKANNTRFELDLKKARLGEA